MPYDQPNPDALELSVRGDLLAAVRHGVDRRIERKYLRGVYIEPLDGGGAILVATNGHILLAGHDPDGFASRGAIIETALTDTQLIKWGGGRKTGARLSHHNVTETCRDYTFPNWRRVIPEVTGKAFETAGQCWHGDYLKRFVTAATRMGGNGGMSFTQPDARSPALVRFSGIPELFGVIMPMVRGAFSGSDSLVPSWMGESYGPDAGK